MNQTEGKQELKVSKKFQPFIDSISDLERIMQSESKKPKPVNTTLGKEFISTQ